MSSQEEERRGGGGGGGGERVGEGRGGRRERECVLSDEIESVC